MRLALKGSRDHGDEMLESICRRLTFVVLAIVLGSSSTAFGDTRNVLLIIADDQGRDLGVYGNPVLRTPNLDRLAARGTLFTNAFATVSSCSPSRSVIYTGLYSHSNGMYGLAHDVHNQHLLPSVRTLPQFLKDAGYRTGLVGKKHILPESALPFDEELAPELPGNRDVAFMADEARKFISKSDGKPFLLIVGYSDPHRAPQNFGNTRTWPRVARATYDPAKVIVPAHLPDLPEVRNDLAQYYESVSRLDSGIGLLLEVLRDTRHEGDTLVIYLSDNGRPFPGAKTTLYDEGIHLPLIVSSPAQSKRGVRNNAMVSWVDITPTILDWTRAAPPRKQQLAGRTILPILEQTDPPGWDRVFASHSFHEIQQYYPMRALRTREYAYIVNLAAPLEFAIAGDVASSPSWQAIAARPSVGLGARTVDAFLHRPAEELYDVRTDPAEVRNLAADPAHQAVLERMRADMAKFRAETHDPWLPGQATVFGHEAEH
jgi:N-sulfoglucosamine sulfohydrolase